MQGELIPRVADPGDQDLIRRIGFPPSDQHRFVIGGPCITCGQVVEGWATEHEALAPMAYPDDRSESGMRIEAQRRAYHCGLWWGCMREPHAGPGEGQ